MRNLILTCFLFLISFSLPAHPIKMTTGKIVYDQNAGGLILTLNFFQDDFEEHLKNTYRLKEMDFVNPSGELKEAMQQYVSKKFTVKINSVEKSFSLRSVKNIEDNVVQTTFLIPGLRGSKIKVLEIFNELLFEAFKDQVNILHAGINGDKESTILKFYPGDAHKVLRPNFQCK